MTPYAILVWVKARGIPFQFTERFTIGKHVLADVIVPDDDYISPSHCMIFRDGLFWYADDRGSANGTWLNGMRVAAPALIYKGAELRVGHTTLLLVPTTPYEDLKRVARSLLLA